MGRVTATGWGALLLFLGCCAPALAAENALACFAPGQTAKNQISACTTALSTGLNIDTRALVLLARADAYVAAGDRAAAHRDFDAVLRITPGHPAALLGRARITDADGKGKEAEADYTAVIALQPAPGADVLGEAHHRRGALRLARGAVAEAADDLLQAGNLLPRDAGVRKLLAQARMRDNDPRAAVAVLNGALGLTPNDIDLLRMRAIAYSQIRNFGPAINDFSAVLTASPEDQVSLEGRGVAALHNGIYGRAAADFSRLAELRPGDTGVIFLRGNAYLQDSRLDEAVQDYTTVLKAHPNDEEALFGRATARQFKGDYIAAEADLGAILAKTPAAAQALARRGNVRFMRGAFADAHSDFASALTLPNAPADLLLWQFIAGARNGEANALATLTAGLQARDPESWPGTIGRYFLGKASGDELTAAARNSPGRLCEAYFFLGQSALIQHEPAEAAKLFTAARATGMTRYTEFVGAGAELARLKAAQAPASPP
jgi:tetratricopeptide (TPR) repeat protein